MTEKPRNGSDGQSSGSSPRARAEAQVAACLEQQVVPALTQVHERLIARGYQARLESGEGWVELSAVNFNGLDLRYAAHGRVYRQPVVTLGGLAAPEHLKWYGRIAVESGGRWREYRLWRCRQAAVERAANRYYQRFLMASPEG